MYMYIVCTSLQDEAFELWAEQWGKLYEDGTTSQGVIRHIMDNYYLVNLVDNDYPQESCLFDIIHKMLDLKQKRSETTVTCNGKYVRESSHFVSRNHA